MCDYCGYPVCFASGVITVAFSGFSGCRMDREVDPDRCIPYNAASFAGETPVIPCDGKRSIDGLSMHQQ